MANATIASQELELALRPIKNRLQARFFQIKSSHLTEAIASGLGFKTNASMRAELIDSPHWRLDYLSIDAARFQERLVNLGYAMGPDLQLGPLPAPPAPPLYYQQWLEQLRALEVGVRKPDYDAIRRLRRRCAEDFAQTFGVGAIENREDKSVIRRWSIGVDHSVCLPGWGGMANSKRGGFIDFPGSDHTWNFCQKLPLSTSKCVTYQSAMVSLPYKDGMSVKEKLAEAAPMAGQLGWTMTFLDEWSWYVPGATHLVLYRPITPHSIVSKQWEGSFKCWLLENRSLLRRSAGDTRRKVIDDILDCQHLPLDLVGYEDCRTRYLKEFARHMYDGCDMASVFKRLMEKWAAADASA